MQKIIERLRREFPDLQITLNEQGPEQATLTIQGERTISGVLVGKAGTEANCLILNTGLLQLDYATERWTLAALTHQPASPEPLPFADDLSAKEPRTITWQPLGPLKVYRDECVVQAGLITVGDGRTLHTSLVNQIEMFFFFENGRQNPYLRVGGVTLAAHDTLLSNEDRSVLQDQAGGWTPEQVSAQCEALERHWPLTMSAVTQVADVISDPQLSAMDKAVTLLTRAPAVPQSFWNDPL